MQSLLTNVTAAAGCLCCCIALAQPTPTAAPCAASLQTDRAAAAGYQPPAMPTTFPGP